MRTFVSIFYWTLMKKNYCCNKKNFDLLVFCLKNCSDDVISEEDKNICFEHLSKIVPTKIVMFREIFV